MKKKCLHIFRAYKYVLGVLRKDEMAYYDSHVKSCDFCSTLVGNVKKIPRSKLEDRVDKTTRELREEREFDRERRVKGCLSVDDMMSYVHGQLYSRKRTYVENHIMKCDDCRENLKKIEKIEKEFGETD